MIKDNWSAVGLVCLLLVKGDDDEEEAAVTVLIFVWVKPSLVNGCAWTKDDGPCTPMATSNAHAIKTGCEATHFLTCFLILLLLDCDTMVKRWMDPSGFLGMGLSRIVWIFCCSRTGVGSVAFRFRIPEVTLTLDKKSTGGCIDGTTFYS